jgi:hypothetical protein
MGGLKPRRESWSKRRWSWEYKTAGSKYVWGAEGGIGKVGQGRKGICRKE